MQELLPLARASRDPCAVAALLHLAGRPVDAVTHLLSCGLEPGSGSAGACLPDAAGGAAAGQRADAAVLDVCLQLGVQSLSGRPVPSWAAGALRRLAFSSSLMLERAGLTAAALEALLVGAALRPAAPGAPGMAERTGYGLGATTGPASGLSWQAWDTVSAAGEGAAGGRRCHEQAVVWPAFNRRYARLLAGCLSYSLFEAQRRQQQHEQHLDGYGTCGSGGTAGSSGGGDAAWRREALRALSRLGGVLGPPVDRHAVLRLLGRHVRALRPARKQPLVPPDLLVCRPLPNQAASPPRPGGRNAAARAESAAAAAARSLSSGPAGTSQASPSAVQPPHGQLQAQPGAQQLQEDQPRSLGPSGSVGPGESGAAADCAALQSIGSAPAGGPVAAVPGAAVPASLAHGLSGALSPESSSGSMPNLGGGATVNTAAQQLPVREGSVRGVPSSGTAGAAAVPPHMQGPARPQKLPQQQQAATGTSQPGPTHPGQAVRGSTATPTPPASPLSYEGGTGASDRSRTEGEECHTACHRLLGCRR